VEATLADKKNTERLVALDARTFPCSGDTAARAGRYDFLRNQISFTTAARGAEFSSRLSARTLENSSDPLRVSLRVRFPR